MGRLIFLMLEHISLKWFPENAAVVSWVIEGGAVDGVWQCVSDGESYVRAAALTALGCLSEVTQVWRHLTTTLGQVLNRSVLLLYFLPLNLEANVGRNFSRFNIVIMHLKH